MVGAGIKTLDQSRKPMSAVMPKRATWIKEPVVSFEPDNNQVVLRDGRIIGYDFLVTALGLSVNFNKVIRIFIDKVQSLCSIITMCTCLNLRLP